MFHFIDQLGKEISFAEKPKRIISIVPSQTEFLFDIGLSEEIVGITKFCIHPNSACESKEKIGGTKNLLIDKILALQPDIIIANKEENEQGQIEELQKHIPVWISDIYNLEDSYEMMRKLGAIFQKEEQSAKIIKIIQNKFAELNMRASNKRVAYFIWRGPYMLAGGNTFIDSLLKKIGLQNIAQEMENGNRYPIIDVAALQRLKPELIYLSSEPYPFKEQHIKELQEICPDAKIQLVDGEMFSWYGSRLKYSADYFNLLLLG